MNLAQRKRLYNLCDPRASLDPADERNVDVDGLDGAVRGRVWLDVLATPIELSRRPVRTLFTGQRGSGVTTELRRLSARLADPSGAGLLVVYVDGAEVVDLHSTIDVADVLFAVLERTAAAVAAAEGEPGVVPLGRFRGWLADLPATSEPDDTPATTILRTSPSARAAFRARVSADLSRFLSDVRGELTLLAGRAMRLGHGGVAVLFDSLTQLRGSSQDWREVLRSAEHLFERDLSYLDLPVHTLYTVPPALVLRLTSPVVFLPQIAILDRRGQRSAAGLAAGREIVRRRVPDTDMKDVFGSDAEERVDRLLASSAGQPRDIVRLLQAVIAEPSPDAQAFGRLLAMENDPYGYAVTMDAYPGLARLHLDKTISVVSEDERERFEQLLTSGAALRYQDDAPWFDVHPAVQRIPGVAEALARREPWP